jgi:hypothetical protein
LLLIVAAVVAAAVVAGVDVTYLVLVRALLAVEVVVAT